MKKFILCFVAMFISLNGYADPCNYKTPALANTSDTFNRLSQANQERLILECQQFNIQRIEKSKEYLDKEYRYHYQNYYNNPGVYEWR